MNTSDKTKFCELYRKAHNNAVELLSEAELLFENKKYTRAYFLAFTGLEEIAKSQLAADVYTTFIDEEMFWKYLKDHKRKIKRMAWASEDAAHYLDLELETYLEIEKPTIAGRMNALYVQFEGEAVRKPDDHLTEDDARGIIHTLRSNRKNYRNDAVLGPPDRYQRFHEIAAYFMKTVRSVHCLKPLEKKTKDHVFPSSWYPETTPPNVQRWTVPSCAECNGKFGEMEKELFIRAAICVGPIKGEAAGLSQKAVESMGGGRVRPECGGTSAPESTQIEDCERN
jgi:AbiV family abortive infection protein